MNTINSTTTKNFNVFGNSNDNGFIDPQQWKSNTVKPISPINRSDVVIGVDLSHTRDLTSISWSFKLDDDKYYCDTFSFVPTNKGTIKAKSKADGINYEALEQDNYCKVCRDAYGYVPDTEAPKYIRYLVEHYHLKTPVTVAFDKWGANYLIQALGNDSRFNLVAVKQNPGNLSETILWLYKLIVSHKLVHEDNPLFDYGFHNISMIRTFTGLPYFNKHRNVEKIDNVFSLLNSLFIQKSLKQQAKTSISNELKNNDFIF